MPRAKAHGQGLYKRAGGRSARAIAICHAAKDAMKNYPREMSKYFSDVLQIGGSQPFRPTATATPGAAVHAYRFLTDRIRRRTRGSRLPTARLRMNVCLRTTSVPKMPKLLVLCLVAALVGSRADARTVTGTVVHVIDGDTIKVLVDHKPIRVRLSAIDAPEIGHRRGDPGQPFGQAARQSLVNLIAGRAVTIHDEGTDRYGRMLGTVYDGPADINAQQVDRGMAWVYRRYSLDPVLLWLEYRAKAAKRGLWADTHPVPPWEYRSSHRGVHRSPASPLTGPVSDHESMSVVALTRNGLDHRETCGPRNAYAAGSIVAGSSSLARAVLTRGSTWSPRLAALGSAGRCRRNIGLSGDRGATAGG